MAADLGDAALAGWIRKRRGGRGGCFRCPLLLEDRPPQAAVSGDTANCPPDDTKN